jgi:hypothetical protein
VLIDRFNDEGNRIDGHLAEKFSVGIKGLPFSPQRRLSNIVGLHYSAIGQSHFPSVVDIVLGSFRFAINAYTRNVQEHMETARILLGLLSPLFFREGSKAVPEIGLQFSPKVVKAERHRARYEGLKAFLTEAGIETRQTITGERIY